MEIYGTDEKKIVKSVEIAVAKNPVLIKKFAEVNTENKIPMKK